jgi:hypothetical protein
MNTFTAAIVATLALILIGVSVRLVWVGTKAMEPAIVSEVYLRPAEGDQHLELATLTGKPVPPEHLIYAKEVNSMVRIAYIGGRVAGLEEALHYKKEAELNIHPGE